MDPIASAATESIMLPSIQPLPYPLVLPDAPPRPAPMRRLARWMLARWQDQCRRAERKDRFVPYY